MRRSALPLAAALALCCLAAAAASSAAAAAAPLSDGPAAASSAAADAADLGYDAEYEAPVYEYDDDVPPAKPFFFNESGLAVAPAPAAAGAVGVAGAPLDGAEAEAYEYDPSMFEDPSAGGAALLPESGSKAADGTATDADTYEYEVTSDQTGDEFAAGAAAKKEDPTIEVEGADRIAGRVAGDGVVRSYARGPDGTLTATDMGEETYTYEYEIEAPPGSEELSDEEVIALVQKQRAEREAAQAAAAGKTTLAGDALARAAPTGQALPGESREAQLAREQKERESREQQLEREEKDRLRAEGKLPSAAEEEAEAAEAGEKAVSVDVKPSSTVGGRGGAGGVDLSEEESALPPVEAVKAPAAASLSSAPAVGAAAPAPAPVAGLSGGAKAGIAFGVLAAIALLAGGTYYVAKHKGLVGGGGAAAGAERAARPSAGSRWSRGGAPA